MKWIRSLALGLLLAGPLQAAQIFNPATEFSIGDNPNGVWTYGYSLSLGGPLIRHAFSVPFDAISQLGYGIDMWWTSGPPWVVRNPTVNPMVNLPPGAIGPGEIGLHPGPNNEISVLRFTAPLDGNYRVTGSFFGQNPAARTDAHIMLKGRSIFDGRVSGVGPGSGPPFDFPLALKSGDEIDFAVGFGDNGNNNADWTGLDARIILQAGVDDAKSDFSPSKNPSGAWTYGYSAGLGSAFAPFDATTKRGSAMDYWFASGLDVGLSVGHNPDPVPRALNEFVLRPGVMTFHPGPSGEYGIVRWTAPSAGVYLLQSSFEGLGGSSTVDLHVLHNGAAIFDDAINGRTKKTGFATTVAVAAGDKIDFAVGFGANGNFSADTTGIDVQFRRVSTTPATPLSIDSAVDLNFTTQPGRIYQLQWASEIDAHTWKNFGSPFIGTGRGTNLFEATRSQAKRFYRVLTFQ